MLDKLRLLRARRLNDRISKSAVLPKTLDDAVALWTRLHENSPTDRERRMGLAEALLRRGNRVMSVDDLRAGEAHFETCLAQRDELLARVGMLMCASGVAWIEKDTTKLARVIEGCAEVRAGPIAMDMVAHLMVIEWQSAARLADVTKDPRDARRAEELERRAQQLLGV